MKFLGRRMALRGAAGAAAAAAASQARAVSGTTLLQASMNASVAAPDAAPMDPKKWDLYRKLTRKESERTGAQLRVASHLGGMPPHIHSCHSWAPWFRAQRAMAWEEEIRLREQSFFDRIRRQVFGDNIQF